MLKIYSSAITCISLLFFIPGAQAIDQMDCSDLSDVQIQDFDSVWDILSNVPNKKDEFETTQQFTHRQIAASSTLEPFYFIEAPIYYEYVRYNADLQIVEVNTYAIANYNPSRDGLSAAFGWSHSPSDLGVRHGFNNIHWTMKSEAETTGSYRASNAFGAEFEILEQNVLHRTIFEREARNSWENLWISDSRAFPSTGAPIAFTVPATPQVARTDMHRLIAAVAYRPTPPYHASAETRFSPTIRAPFDRNEEHRYLIGDIQCVALFRHDGTFLVARPTQ